MTTDQIDLDSFSDQVKLRVIEREIAMRRNVYPKWVNKGKMKPDAAQHEIDVMVAIAADYKRRIFGAH